MVDEDQHAADAERDPRHTAPGYAFLEENGRNDKCHDGAQRRQDGGINGRGLRDGEQKGDLRHEQAQERRQGHLSHIFACDMFARCRKQRPYPEQRCCAERAQTEQRHRRDVPVHRDPLAADDVEPENGIGRKARQISGQCAVGIFHN